MKYIGIRASGSFACSTPAAAASARKPEVRKKRTTSPLTHTLNIEHIKVSREGKFIR